MMYDLFADFFVKSSDSHPKYTVQMGSYYPKTIGEMEEIGFVEDNNGEQGYLDYFMEADQEDLERFTQEGFESEILDALFSGDDWERIQIRAVEVEVIDDYGNYPPKGVSMGDTHVFYEKTNPSQRVIISHGNPFEDSGEIQGFEVSVWRLRRRMGAKTLMEALEKMREKVNQEGWTYKTFYKFIRFGNCNAILLEEITPAFGMGNYIAFTLREEFERRSEIQDYDPVLLFINRTGNDLDYWFDRAHVAETLAPLSLWEIKDDERENWTNWLHRNFKRSHLENMLIQYTEAIANKEHNDTP